MIRRPPRSTRTDTLFPYTTLFRSTLAATWFHPPASRQIGQPVPEIGTEAARLTGAVLEARSEGRKAPPLGGFAPAGSRPAAAPERFAILPPGIPHDEPALPARSLLRSEERRVGQACVGTVRSRRSTCHEKNKSRHTHQYISL